MTTKEAQELIQKNQLIWFDRYKDFVQNGKILIVGHGLGCTTEIISTINPNTVGLDVVLEQGATMKDKVVVYDGKKIPFADRSFDVVVATYVLHHADNPSALFSEMVRVSKSNLILLEETYKNFLQKIDLVYFDWYFNRKANQTVAIHWNSYLTSRDLMQYATEHNLKIVERKHEPLRSYETELFVFRKL